MKPLLFLATLVALLIGSAPAQAQGRYYDSTGVTVRVYRSDSLWGGTRTRTQVGVRTRNASIWVDREDISRRDDRYRRDSGSRYYRQDDYYDRGYGRSSSWRDFEPGGYRDDSNLTRGEIRGMWSDPNFWGKQEYIQRDRDRYYGGYRR